MAFDESFDTLQAIVTEILAAIVTGGTEQDARLRIIDRLLTTVLGWPHDQIRTEVNNGGGFADYALLDEHDRYLAIVEAKKTGILRIDTASQTKTAAKLNGQVLRSATTEIAQAAEYYTECGTPYGIVTDGNAWIFFRATRTDGIPPKEGRAIIFPSFTSLCNDFATFYELLAPTSLYQKLYLARLNAVEGLISRPREQRFYVRSPDEARMLPRSDLGRDIAEVFNRFFATISSEHDEEMRRTCFVESKESKDADATLTKIAVYLTNTIQAMETRHGHALQTEIETVIASRIAEICLIIGNKGAGKSTFIGRFFADVLPQTLRRSCVVASIDLADYTRDEKTISIQRWPAERLCDSLEDAIFRDQRPTYEDYQGMFFRVYQRWSEGTYRHLYETNREQFKIQFGDYVEKRRAEQPDDYVVGLMLHTAAGRRRLPCIVFDNTDQFSLETQEQVFQFAVGLKNAALSFIVVPITDRSIWRLSKSGAFQSYVSRSFYLPTPLAKEVLSKRIAYLRTKLEMGDNASGVYFGTKGIRISIPNLTAFVNILEDAFVRNEALSGLVSRLANFDIRRMLMLAKRTITSPTFQVEDFIRIYIDSRWNAFDYRKALRGVILGDYDRHVNETDEFFYNVFWTDGMKPTSPLLNGSILSLLQSAKAMAVRDPEKGYVTFSDLANLFEPCGVDGNDVREAVQNMMLRGLVEPFDPNTESVTEGVRLGIASSGLAHLELMVRESVYLEQMALATGYRAQGTRDAMQEAARDIGRPDGRDRVRRVFSEYLLSEDRAKMNVPAPDIYEPLRKLRRDVAEI